MGHTVLLILAGLILAVLLELGKRTVPGWLVSAGLFAAFILIYNRFLSGAGRLPRLGGWALFVLLLALTFHLFRPPIRPVPAVEEKNVPATGVITLAQGPLTGVVNADRTVEVYAGIPYAAPPVGDLRWKAPQEPESWEGIRACNTFAPMAMQSRTNTVFDSLTHIAVYHDYKISLHDNWLPDMSEDCLYLNVWKPAGEVRNAPVLVYIHGGSLTTGQSWYGDYNGETLASRGIVVVNIAYRLNVFGYFASSELLKQDGTTGNYGLLDQIQALRWVQKNIAAFGGDPEKVTIAGESAGASSVGALCVSPLSQGLFRYAIAESSGITAKVPYHTFRPLSDALETGEAIRREFGADDMAALRALSAEKLLATKHANSAMTVDGYAITEQPYLTYARRANHEQALLSGFNAHEAELFTLFDKVTKENYVNLLAKVLGDGAAEAAELFPPRETDPRYHYIVDRGGDAKGAYNQVLSGVWFTYSHYNWSRLLTEQGVPCYEYFFTRDNKGLGANHSGEMVYAYGNLFRNPGLYDETDEALSQIMVSYWENFIRTGDPNGERLPDWPTFAAAPTEVLELGDTVAMRKDPWLALYPIIDRFQDKEAVE